MSAVPLQGPIGSGLHGAGSSGAATTEPLTPRRLPKRSAWWTNPGASRHTTSAVPKNGVPHWVCRAAVVGACSCQLSEWTGCMKRKGVHAEGPARGVGLSKTVLLRFRKWVRAFRRFLYLTSTMCHGWIATVLAPPAPECDIWRGEVGKLPHSISLPKVSSVA